MSRSLVDHVAMGLRALPGIERGLVIAVSGGADSVALFRGVLAVRETVGLRAIVLAHLNHRLRGADSDTDEQFVRDLLAIHAPTMPELKLACHGLDVRDKAAAHGENLEAAARQIRYGWLEETARAENIAWIATGHTANDQAETILHRLIRGTGFQGLRGIAARRKLGHDLGLVRPLLPVTRTEILVYLRELGQSHRHDASNDDLGLMRNRIRHELLPLLQRQYNPGAVAVMCRLAEQAEEFFNAEVEAVEALLKEAEKPRAGTMLVLDRARLARSSHGLVRALFRHIWSREGWPMDTMNFDAWERLAGLVFEQASGLDLPGGVRASPRGDILQIQRNA